MLSMKMVFLEEDEIKLWQTVVLKKKIHFFLTVREEWKAESQYYGS